jgi:hypothetical protein
VKPVSTVCSLKYPLLLYTEGQCHFTAVQANTNVHKRMPPSIVSIGKYCTTVHDYSSGQYHCAADNSVEAKKSNQLWLTVKCTSAVPLCMITLQASTTVQQITVWRPRNPICSGSLSNVPVQYHCALLYCRPVPLCSREQCGGQEIQSALAHCQMYQCSTTVHYYIAGQYHCAAENSVEAKKSNQLWLTVKCKLGAEIYRLISQ